MSNINVDNITPLAGITGTVSVSGSLHVSGSVTANGNIVLGNEVGDSVSLGAEVSSSIIPDANNTYDLGSNAKTWKTMHQSTASIGVVSSSLIPNSTNTYDLGASTSQYKDLYAAGNSTLGNAAADTHTFTGDITASGNISASGTVEGTSFIHPTSTLVSVDAVHCGSTTGNKFTVQNQLQAAIADGDTSALFTVGNTSVNTDSVIYGTLNGTTTLIGGLSQSSLNIHVNAANSMSFCFADGEGGQIIADDTPFTASFVVF